MEHDRAAPLFGILGCVLTVAAVLAPYVVVTQEDQPVVSQYYELGVITPLALAVLALVGIIAFAAGLKGRTDPSVVAGLLVGLGVFSLFVATHWALAVPETVGQSAETADFLAFHRWTVPTTTGLIMFSAIWYSWALGLLSE